MAARIVLVGTSPHIQGLHWDFSGNLCIGRQPSADLVLEHPSVDRRHAEIIVTPRGWMVRNLSSAAGGTLVNGLALPQTPRRLQKDDVIQCGKLQLQISELEEEARPAPPISKGPADLKATGQFMCVQAISQRSWEEGLREVRPDDTRAAPGKHFLTLLQGGYYLSRIHCARDFFQTFLDDTLAVLNARRAAIVLHDDAREEFQLRTVSLSKGLVQGQRCFSTTLARRCFFNGESILCQDIAQARKLANSQSGMFDEMGSILCMMLRTARRRLGILHLDRGPFQDPFTQDDFALAETIVAGISAAMESALTVEKQHGRLARQAQELARLLLEKSDPNLVERGQRVSQLAGWLGEKLRLEPDEVQELALGGLLFELGAVPGLVRLAPFASGHRDNGAGAGADGPVQPGTSRLERILAVARALDDKLHPAPGQRSSAPAEVVAWFQARAEFDPECVEILSTSLPACIQACHQAQSRASND